LAQGASVNGNLSTSNITIHICRLVANHLGLDKAGNTPLHWAARSKHPDAVQILLTKSPMINVQNKMGDTPLHSACWGGSLDVVKLITQVAGIKFDIKNKSKESPLDLAKNDDVAAFLIQYTCQKTNAQDLLDDD
jgi:ankyrin repeat protein